MTMYIVNVLLGGPAGQGLAAAGQGLAKALVKGGWDIVVVQSYHSRIRGGHNAMTVRIGCTPLQAPQEAVDLLAALDADTLELHSGELSPRGVVLAGNDIKPSAPVHLKAPWSDLAPGRFVNAAVLGAVGALLGLDRELLAAGLADFLGKKPADVMEANRASLSAAYQWAREQNTDFEPLGPPLHHGPRLMLQGNQAIALGAVSAGVKFCSFYPMTPATSIALTLASLAEDMGLAVEQAEDEIAAVNMAIGASFAGAPALTPTSGGGFALTAEGISLAAMTETPLLIVLSQRPGPATGLPTRTEQGDLEFALHAGHGEFPRAVFAPGDVEQCFYLTRRAAALAEQFQGPVILLTDQFLADSFRSTAPFPVEELDPGASPRLDPAGEEPYQRYAYTDSGVSPRRLPGFSPALVSADSDEHDPAGHITEDLAVRVRMQDKRMRKLEGLRREATPPAFGGAPEPELLLVCWGSTLGSAAEAAQRLRAQGVEAGYCHFSQVWPLVPDSFLPRFQKAGRVIFVEGNGGGQFARLVRRETGFSGDGLVLRYDGLPITPEYILRGLEDA
jgi:2-oxoglutarate ferredoxin oxidoreductase subunit alpha